jgi:quercetin dioxygenase-like cupin family protein
VPEPKRSSMRKAKVTVVPSGRGERVALPKGSFSDLIITDGTTASNSSMLGYSVFTPGTETKQKVHVDAEELAYIVSGTGRLSVGREVIWYKAGDSLHIPAGVPHGIGNDGKEDLVMVFFFPTPNYPRTVDG